jgi:hypothetical protein
MSIDVSGVAETSLAVAHPLPTVRPAADHWAGGGVTLYVDPVFAVQVATLEECLAVTPEVAARWPMPSFVESLAASSAVLHLEQQSAAALATVTIDRRIARLESTRVTTVEISPGAVLGRAACDVRVASGEAFAISAQVAQEWFIDSVEAVEWQPAGSADRPDDGTGDGPMQPMVDAGRTVEWRVVQSGGGGELRIELAEAATPSRSLGLRITGHRRGVPLGGEFATADMDMVRLEGESAESALPLRGRLRRPPSRAGSAATAPVMARASESYAQPPPTHRVRLGEGGQAPTPRRRWQGSARAPGARTERAAPARESVERHSTRAGQTRNQTTKLEQG